MRRTAVVLVGRALADGGLPRQPPLLVVARAPGRAVTRRACCCSAGRARRASSRPRSRGDGVPVISSLAGRVARPAAARGRGARSAASAAPRASRAGWPSTASRPSSTPRTRSPSASRRRPRSPASAPGVPLLRLERPGWSERRATTGTGSTTPAAAAAAIAGLGQPRLPDDRAAGPRGVRRTCRRWFLVRCIDPPEPPLPAEHELLLDRGPYTLEGELALIDRHRIDLLVTKDSGGQLTEAKLDAAREPRPARSIVIRPPAAARGRRRCADVAGRARRGCADEEAPASSGSAPAIPSTSRRRRSARSTRSTSSSSSRRATRSTTSSTCAARSASATSSARRTARSSCRDPERDRTAPAYARPSRPGGTRARSCTRRRSRAELGRGRVRRVPGLGRSCALRQHARDRRRDPRARRARVRLRGRARHQQRSGAGGAPPHRAQPHRRPIQITTGRRLAEGLHDGVDDVVVMLDARLRVPALAPTAWTSTGAPTSARRTRS